MAMSSAASLQVRTGIEELSATSRSSVNVAPTPPVSTRQPLNIKHRRLRNDR